MPRTFVAVAQPVTQVVFTSRLVVPRSVHDETGGGQRRRGRAQGGHRDQRSGPVLLRGGPSVGSGPTRNRVGGIRSCAAVSGRWPALAPLFGDEFKDAIQSSSSASTEVYPYTALAALSHDSAVFSCPPSRAGTAASPAGSGPAGRSSGRTRRPGSWPSCRPPRSTAFAPRAGERGGQVRPIAAEDGLVVPRAVADELLGGLLRVRARQPVGQGHAVGEGFDALSLAVGQEALQVPPAHRAGLAWGKSTANSAA